jgi:hypothetical protein
MLIRRCWRRSVKKSPQFIPGWVPSADFCKRRVDAENGRERICLWTELLILRESIVVYRENFLNSQLLFATFLLHTIFLDIREHFPGDHVIAVGIEVVHRHIGPLLAF